MPGDYHRLSIEEAAASIQGRTLSPVELTEALLARIERVNPVLNAFITVTAESALDEARTAEKAVAHGGDLGPLHGIPIAHKDIVATRGVRTTGGSKILADWIPDADAAVVAKLRDAGAICLGKLNTDEFALGTTSDNEHYGPVRNPWQTEHGTGGSSGGSAASVTAGLCFAATGTDTGGSIRIPAAACGCVGLKPTYGRVSMRGIIPSAPTLDHVGPFARSVRDAAIMLQAMAGHDPEDSATEDRAMPNYLDGVERGPEGLTIGVPRQHFFEQLDPAVEAVVRRAIGDLESAGATTREVEFEAALDYARAYIAVMLAESAVSHAEYFPSRRDEFGRGAAWLLDLGPMVTGMQYVQSRQTLDAARRTADAVLDGVDVLLIPSMPCTVPTITAAREHNPAVRLGAFTSIFNLTGQPVISVPYGLASDRLPVGVSFVARRWNEAAALRAGRALELVRGELPAPPL